jgi:hypothetical protein
MSRGQVGSIDFIASIVIVSIVTTIFIQYIFSSYSTGESISDLSTEAARISESLMSAGLPNNWTEADVRRIGLTDDNWRINETKAVLFYQIPDSKIRHVLGTDSKLHIALYNGTNPISVGGFLAVGEFPFNAKKIASISRYVIYRSSVMELRVRVWQ